MAAPQILKYPRTTHLEGSRIQKGDEDLKAVRLSSLRGRFCVFEEKLDGANCGLRFDSDGKLWLQSRGHFLLGGPREEQFDLFKAWAGYWRDAFFDLLGDRFVLYGEWLHAAHTCYYDRLPHYFFEFDMLEIESGRFLSTRARRELLDPFPHILSVPVLSSGPAPAKRSALAAMVGPSLAKSADPAPAMERAAKAAGADLDMTREQLDCSSFAEGLYVKVEEGDYVVGRHKWVRAEFLQAIEESGSHWNDRPLILNALRPGASVFDAAPSWSKP